MGWEVHGGKRSLPQSLCLVARFGLRNGLAQGYAVDKLLDSGEAWERKLSEGLPVPMSDGNGLALVSFPLGTEETETGALSFVGSATSLRDARPALEEIAGVCQAIWRTWYMHAAYARDILRIADLEAELADSKIADRARALLEMGKLHTSPVTTISRSVATILGPYQLGKVLKKLMGDLERDAADYALIRQAKSLLQHRQNITEAEAYLQLREVSRQTGRPLPDIAREVMKLGFIAPRDRKAPGTARRA